MYHLLYWTIRPSNVFTVPLDIRSGIPLQLQTLHTTSYNWRLKKIYIDTSYVYIYFNLSAPRSLLFSQTYILFLFYFNNTVILFYLILRGYAVFFDRSCPDDHIPDWNPQYDPIVFAVPLEAYPTPISNQTFVSTDTLISAAARSFIKQHKSPVHPSNNSRRLFFFFFLILLIADGPHNYHPTCGH